MTASVLIIEDNPEICSIYTDLLSDEYKLKTLNSLNCVRRYINDGRYQTPDLAIIDLQLEDGDFVNLLKEDPCKRQIAGWRKIFVSGKNDLNIMSDCFDLGAVDFLTKPFDKNELLLKCRRALKTHAFPILDQQSHALLFKGLSSQPLTSTECRIYNAIRTTQEISKEALIGLIWNEDQDNPKLAVHISRLRKKLISVGWSINYSKKNKSYTFSVYDSSEMIQTAKA